MEYLIKNGDNRDDFGTALSMVETINSDDSCPRLGCCPKGGRSIPIGED